MTTLDLSKPNRVLRALDDATNSDWYPIQARSEKEDDEDNQASTVTLILTHPSLGERYRVRITASTEKGRDAVVFLLFPEETLEFEGRSALDFSSLCYVAARVMQKIERFL